ncbi:hypothetical protein SAMN06273570_5096 [Candidatus Pantoea floridensis]|uniref:Uncharacterized protein n=1 Tax=Candidatus Pantoea floridensis TaxID=1938870 RepID=A0A286DRP3_9GAMM|nr:hypothetical protein BX596_4949 [Enterobacteriaceae bacterium JKS000233]SOD61335.1 hypothetical protein SAMN06273570_5096 [Pantoea floridensis]
MLTPCPAFRQTIDAANGEGLTGGSRFFEFSGYVFVVFTD